MLCIESMAHAMARGARPYCEIAGWGLSASPSPPTDWPEDPRGPVLAIQRALACANITAGDINHVSASASGGRKLDRLEAEALCTVFAGEKKKPIISAIKGALGESFSSGGIRTAAAAISLREKSVPPTLGLDSPILPFPFAFTSAVQADMRFALINGFSSGGTFASLILKRIDAPA